MNRNNVVELINVDRITEDLWKLVCIPSPTGHERKAALVFAEMLSSAGAEVEIDEKIYESPNIIGRLKGNSQGKIFQLAGHIDHIDVPHATPSRDNETISGRGAADMKNGLAGILEVVRVLKESKCDFPGEVLVTVYGLHEAPVGDSAGLLDLIKRGICGDAALVAENVVITNDKAVIQGNGMSIWNITLRRVGEVCHELNRPCGADNLLDSSLKVAERLQDYNLRLQSKENGYKLLMPESSFVGQMHYGDFYNRAPTTCTLQGTLRWHPCHNFSTKKKEIDNLLQNINYPDGISVDYDCALVGESYEIGTDEIVVKALRGAYKSVMGKSMEYSGISAITDAQRLVSLGNIPTVLCGFDNKSAHAEHEYVRINQFLKPCQITLLTLLNYLKSIGKGMI